jgi:hypothetical protein
MVRREKIANQICGFVIMFQVNKNRYDFKEIVFEKIITERKFVSDKKLAPMVGTPGEFSVFTNLKKLNSLSLLHHMTMPRGKVSDFYIFI